MTTWYSENRGRLNRDPDVDQREQYLELIASGVPHYNAAHMVGSTARAFKSLRRRDLVFQQSYEEAEVQRPDSLEDLVRGSLWARAFGHLWDGDAKEDGKSFEAQKILAEAVLPELEYKRVRSVRHGQEGPFEVLVGQKVSTDALEGATDEQFEILEQAYKIIRELQGGPVAGELRAIEGGRE
jgi:hypothetical protein